MPDRRPVIVTFKKKDVRRSDVDKQELLKSILSSGATFLSQADFAAASRLPPSNVDMSSVGYDVNRYDAPILMARLSDREVDDLNNHSDVERVEDDGRMYALGHLLTSTSIPMTQVVPTGVSQIRADAVWPTSRGEGIKVFVLDSGIDAEHPDLMPNLRGGRSFVPREPSMEDLCGHGTHCAGTVAAADNGTGVVGVAPGALLYSGKVLDSTGAGNWSWLIAALDWVMYEPGARIVSMSLGSSHAPLALRDMCQSAYDRGVLLVAAAGNAGPGDDTVGFPARYPSVMAVSAVDSEDLVAEFSSRGREVEISAPGVDVLSTMPGSGYGTMSGTSMACPHVSGVAALAWRSHRCANNRQIRWLLDSSACLVGDGDRHAYGDGRVDALSASRCVGATPEYRQRR